MPFEAFRLSVGAYGRSWRRDSPMGVGDGSTRSKGMGGISGNGLYRCEQVHWQNAGVSPFRAFFAGEDNQSRLCSLPNSALFGGKTGPMGYEKVALPPRTIGWKGF
jgi:hypothetical protein